MFCEIDLKNGMKMGFEVAGLDADEVPRKTVYIYSMSKTHAAGELGTTWGILKLKKAEYWCQKCCSIGMEWTTLTHRRR